MLHHAFSGLNSYYIIVAGSLYKADTYQRVVRRAVGNTASWIAVFTLFLLNFGACIVTLQVIGHGCSDILKSASVDHPNIRDTIGWESLSVLVVSTVCILPLSLLRHVVSQSVLSNKTEYMYTHMCFFIRNGIPHTTTTSIAQLSVVFILFKCGCSGFYYHHDYSRSSYSERNRRAS